MPRLYKDIQAVVFRVILKSAQFEEVHSINVFKILYF